MDREQVDVVIIGAGGAGLTAAIYTSRAALKTIILDKGTPGGQIAITDLVENFPGFPEGILGPDIGMKMEAQAKKYGADIRFLEVHKIKKEKDGFVVLTESEPLRTKSVIIATGAVYRHLGIPGEHALTGHGVSYCATCDGAFFRNKNVAVIGGGDSALQEGLFLTTFAKQLFIVHRRDELRAGPILQKRAREHAKISFILDTVPVEIKGDKLVNALVLKNVKTGEVTEMPIDGVFIFIGHDPASSIVQEVVECTEHGYIRTNSMMQTSIPGIFACGEVREGATRQLIAACGEGCQAALSVQHYLENL